MDKLTRDSSLHKIVSHINEIVDTVNSYMVILDTLNNSSLGEQVKYSSTQDAKVIGEVFTVKIPGLYVVKTLGSGTTSVLIQRNGDLKVSETVILYSDQESKELLLSSNDKLLFYVTSTREVYTAQLILKEGLFSVTKSILDSLNQNNRLLEETQSKISNSIDSYAREYQSLVISNRQLKSFVESQLNSMNEAIKELSDKVNT